MVIAHIEYRFSLSEASVEVAREGSHACTSSPRMLAPWAFVLQHPEYTLFTKPSKVAGSQLSYRRSMQESHERGRKNFPESDTQWQTPHLYSLPSSGEAGKWSFPAEHIAQCGWCSYQEREVTTGQATGPVLTRGARLPRVLAWRKREFQST